MVAAMRWRFFLVAAGLAGMVTPAGATDRIINMDTPIVPTTQMAQPAAPAPLEESSKHFIKAEPTSSAPRLSPRPEGVGPILKPLKLKGHTDMPPSTTAPLRATRVPTPGD